MDSSNLHQPRQLYRRKKTYNKIRIYSIHRREQNKGRCRRWPRSFSQNTRIFSDSYKLPDYATVFQAEIYAIQRAAEYALSEIGTYGFKYVKILTDSQASMLALNKTEIKSKLVLETLEQLETLATMCRKVTITWVKAHVNITGNEMADEAAKEGTTKQLQLTTLAPPENILKDTLKATFMTYGKLTGLTLMLTGTQNSFTPAQTKTRPKV